jgi:ribosome-associated translation inhibitor RaiA
MEMEIRERAASLDHYYPDITSCHVAIDIPHRHHRTSNPFHVLVDITVPGEEITVKKEGDAGVVVHEAFNAARRQLQDYASRRRTVTS